MLEKKRLQHAEMHQHTLAHTYAHPLAHTLAHSLVLVFNLFALTVR